MKRKMFLFVAALVLLFVQSAFAQTEELPDTVWTKFTYPKEVRAVKFTPDGRYLATGGSDAIPKLWDVETGELVHQFPGRPTGIWDISIAGNMLAFFGPGENGIQIYDLNTLELIKSLQGSQYGDFSSDGKYLVTDLNSGITVIDTKDWSVINSIGLSTFTIKISVSPDDKFVAISEYFTIGNDDKTGYISIYKIPDLKYVTTLEKKDYLNCRDLAFSNSNEHLAGAISDSPNKVWNTSDWKVFKEFGSDALSVAFSPDGKYVILGGGGFKNWHLSVWDKSLGLETNNYRLDWLAKKHLNLDEGDNPFSIDITNDSKKIAIGGSVGIYLLNAKWNPTSIIENPVHIIEPVVFPNPTNSTANIRFELLKPTSINIQIYDINSRLIASIFEGFLEPGLQNFQWNISRVPSGTYFAKISANGIISSVNIIVNK